MFHTPQHTELACWQCTHAHTEHIRLLVICDWRLGITESIMMTLHTIWIQWIHY